MAKIAGRRHPAQGGRHRDPALGARGYSKDTPLEWMYRYARQARLVDGASEVHRMVVAQELLKDEAAFFRWS